MFSDSNQGSRFFGFVDGLIAEHQALQIRYDGVIRENEELQRRLQEHSHMLESRNRNADAASTQSPGEIQLSCPPPPSTKLSFPSFPGDTQIVLHDTVTPRKLETRVSPGGQLMPLPSPDESNESSNSVSLIGVEELDGTPRKARIRSSEHMNVPRDVAIQRLRARLGHISDTGIVTPLVLHHAVSSLGLEKYGVEEITEIMYTLKSHYLADLAPIHMADQAAGQKLEKEEVAERCSQPSRRRRSSVLPSVVNVNENRAVGVDAHSKSPLVEKTSRGPVFRSLLWALGIGSAEDQDWQDDVDSYSMHFNDFVDIMLEESPRNFWSSAMEQKMLTIREVLMSAEANRLIAELMHIRIDDLASPPLPPDFLQKMEPVVNFMIFANGVIVGIQTDSEDGAQSPVFLWTEVTFVLFFTVEMILRMYFTGVHNHFLGNDWAWNVFDASVMSISYVDLGISFVQSSSDGGVSLSVVRLIRLTRLSRMLRMLRFKCFQELALMIKGLMGGFRTLVWATVLLVFAIYVIAVFCTALIGKSKAVDLDPDTKILFEGVFMSMFTGFRCFTGDCTDEAGNSIPLKLEKVFGETFALSYCITTMMVTFGIFNIIIAIYIENTLEAAKLQATMDKKTRDRESLRVAHATKALLKKFCRAVRFFGRHVQDDRMHALKMGKLFRGGIREQDDDIDDFDMAISKDLFLLVIQDPTVQSLFDQLDIPPDRASLFDVLDADGNGDLEVTELVHGLLKVRGEARKSDVVAALLSVRAVQEQLRRMDAHLHDCNTRVNDLCSRPLVAPAVPLQATQTSRLPTSMGEDSQVKPQLPSKPCYI